MAKTEIKLRILVESAERLAAALGRAEESASRAAMALEDAAELLGEYSRRDPAMSKRYVIDFELSATVVCDLEDGRSVGDVIAPAEDDALEADLCRWCGVL